MSVHIEDWLTRQGEAFAENAYRRYGEDGLDAMQKCAMIAWKNKVSFADDGHAERWMWKCIRHRLLEAKRGKLVQRIIQLQDGIDLPAPGERAIEDGPLIHCWQGLSANQQRILKEHFWEGKSYAQIAREMEIRPNTANSHARRGLIQLRTCLANKGLGFADLVD